MPDDSWNPTRRRHPAAPAVRDLRPERLRDRHGHDRHLAVRAPAGGPGGDPVPVDVPRHGAPSSDGTSYHVETLNDQALWDAAPIVPKTPPNPLRNDKDFLTEFPYLAEPW